MANLGAYKINTLNNYQKVSDLIGLTFEDDKTYTLQVQGRAYIINSATVPTEGGFLLKDNQIVNFTKEAGVDFYIKTNFWLPCVLNIAE